MINLLNPLLLSLLQNSIFENCNSKFGDFHIFINLTNQTEIYYHIHWHFLKPSFPPYFDIHKKLFSIKFGIKPDCNSYFSYFWSVSPINYGIFFISISNRHHISYLGETLKVILSLFIFFQGISL